MYTIKVHNRVDQVISVFHFIGLWSNDNWTDFRKFSLRMWYLCSHVCLPMSLAAGAITSENWIETIFFGVISISALIQTFRLYFFLWKQDEIVVFTHIISSHSIKDLKEFCRVNNKIENFMKFASYYHCMIFCGAITVIVLALPIISHKKQLPMNMTFPFDWKQSEIIYWIAFGFVAYEVMFSVLCAVFNTFIWYLMMSCATKYEILGNEFRNLGVDGRLTALKKEKFSADKLILVVKGHKALQQYTIVSYHN